MEAKEPRLIKELQRQIMEAKEPRLIKELHRQIMAHPKYPTIKESSRWAFENGCVGGLSWCHKANNKWSRAIWRQLYAGGPIEVEYTAERDAGAVIRPTAK